MQSLLPNCLKTLDPQNTRIHRKTNYKTHMETIDGELRRILDSTYNDISDKIRPTLNINQKYSTNIPRRS